MSVNYNRFGQSTSEMDGASATMSVDEKMTLISRNLDEVCKREIMEKILVEEKRDIKIYWGTATTGKPHVAYFVPMSKIADFLRAGCEVTILFADIHGYLDNMKSTFELLKHRTEYYKQIISATLESIGVPLEKLTFRTGSEYQLTPEFTLDILKLTTLCSQHDAQRAGAEVVKQAQSPPLSGLLYPIYQWLDEEYLHVDAQFGGVDQRKIFMSAQEYLPKIGYKARAHLMNPMVPGLTGEKMSSSEVDSKIDLIDDEKSVKKKINKVFCEEGNLEKNPLLAFVKSVVFLVRGEFTLHVQGKDDVLYTDYAKLSDDFAGKGIHPADLKQSVIAVLNSLLAPIRKRFEDPKLVELTNLAYPTATPGDKKKKEKKQAGGGAAAAAVSATAKAILDRHSAQGVVVGKLKSEKASKEDIKAAVDVLLAIKAEYKAETGEDINPPKAKGKGKGGGGGGGDAPAGTDMSRMLLKVGKIISVEKHPNADSMYVEKIDVGEAEPRTVVSGLVGKIEMDALQDRMVVVVCNLKPANLRSIKSHAMLLCASNADGTAFECLDPPADAPIGERVMVVGHEGIPDENIKPGSTKKGPSVWEKAQPLLKTTSDKVVQFDGVDLTTTKGPITVASLAGAAVK